MCVDIDRIEPLITFRTQTEWIEINFRKELLALTNSSYQCVFTPFTSETQIRTDALQITSSKLKCSLPHSSKLQALFQSNLNKQQDLELSDDGVFKLAPNGVYYYEQKLDSLSLGIHVENSQSSNIKYGALSSSKQTQFNITVIDCDAHKSCISCTQSSSSKCKWCSSRCVNPSDLSSNSLKCLTDASYCSSFDPGTNKLLIPYTAHRPQAALLFALYNTDLAENSKLECMFTIFNGKLMDKNLSLPFQLVNKTHAHCVLSNVFSSLSPFIEDEHQDSRGQVQTNLRLYDKQSDIFIDSSSNGKLSLLFYKCELKANDCSQCLSINPQLSCMWCANSQLGALTHTAQTQSSCRFMNAQSKLAALSQCISPASSFFAAINNQTSKHSMFNQCDKPHITSVQPVKLPVGGGTTLVINGLNLGSTFDDLVSVNIICGNNFGDSSSSLITTKCDLIEQKYLPSKQIACKTRQSGMGAQKECRVSVKLKTHVIISGSSTTELGSSGLMSILVSGSQRVEYVDPIINEIEPSTIIQSANFVWLTIKGVDLDAGKTRQIQIIDYASGQQQQQLDFAKDRVVKCEVKNSTSKEIRCRLNDKFKTLGKKFKNYFR